MKFSLFKNDKSTVKDEVILFFLIVSFFLIGLLLYLKAPSFWIISSGITKSLGLLGMITAFLFVPGLIYRLATNEKPDRDKKK